MVSGGETAVAKKAPAPKKSKPSSHPPYFEMTKEALFALKERTGSSHYAIAKHIEEQQKVTLPPNFKKLLSVQLKKLVASGKLTKVKNSFKLGPAEKKPSKDSKPKLKPAAAAAKVKEGTERKAKSKGAAPAKAKSRTVSKPKVVPKPAKKEKKAAKTSAKSPAKKVAAAKVKKAAMKRPKSIKSPAKKATMCKRVRK